MPKQIAKDLKALFLPYRYQGQLLRNHILSEKLKELERETIKIIRNGFERYKNNNQNVLP